VFEERKEIYVANLAFLFLGAAYLVIRVFIIARLRKTRYIPDRSIGAHF
jgi:hypothetical protein